MVGADWAIKEPFPQARGSLSSIFRTEPKRIRRPFVLRWRVNAPAMDM
jgi:hypothetical protein